MTLTGVGGAFVFRSFFALGIFGKERTVPPSPDRHWHGCHVMQHRLAIPLWKVRLCEAGHWVW